MNSLFSLFTPRRTLLVISTVAGAVLMPARARAQSGPPAIAITPSNGTFTTPSLNVSIDWSEPDATPLDRSSIVITLNSTNVAGSFSNGVGLTHFISTGTITLASGSNTLSATICNTDAVCSTQTADYTYSPSSGYLTADLSNATVNNYDHQQVSLCEAACFAATQTLSTVPYFSQDQPRSVTLVYNGDQMAVRPIISADVHLTTGAPTLLKYQLQVQDSTGAYMTFTNGETTLNFQAPGSPITTTVRLKGQLDLSTYSSGVYPFTAIVTAVYSGSSDVVTTPTKVMVVNERKSPIAKGWTVAGLSRLKVQTDGIVLTEGDGSGVFFPTCGSSCYAEPSGELTSLSQSGSGTGLVFTRWFRDNSKADYDYTGKLIRLISPSTLDTTAFTYDGAGRLSRVYDPFRTTTTNVHLYTELKYKSAFGLDSIIEPGPGQSQTNGRKTAIAIGSDSTLSSWKDPDGVLTQLSYDASKRLQRILNRRGDSTHFVYDATTWKLKQVLASQVAIAAANGTTTNARPTTNLSAWQAVGLPLTTTASTPAAAARSDTIKGSVTDPGGHKTTFTVDRWGQPLVVTDPIGNVTTISRAGIFETTVTAPTGAVDRYEYNGTTFLQWMKPAAGDTTYYSYDIYNQTQQVTGPGQPVQQFYRSAAWKLDSARVTRDATQWYTTKYTYDSRRRPLTMVDPAGATHTTSLRYNTTFGNSDSTWGPGGRYAARSFDGYGRDSSVRAPGGVSRRLLYDVLNRVVNDSSVGDPKAKTFTYDSLFLRRVVDSKGQVFKRDVNALGWVTRDYDPADTVNRYMSYRYTLDGLLGSYTDRRSERVDLTYDVLHRLTLKAGTNVTADSFFYNARDTIRVGKNVIGTDSLVTDASGRIIRSVSMIFGQSYTQRYYYTKPSQLDSTTITGGTPTPITFAKRQYFWNAKTAALDSVRLNGALATSFTRNNEGLELSRSWPSAFGATRSASYTTTHGSISLGYSNASLDAAFTRTYGYDQLSRIAEIDIPAASDNRIRSFNYDKVGRLARTQEGLQPRGTCSTGGTFTDDGYNCDTGVGYTLTKIRGFTYDAAGNLIQQRDSTLAVSDTGKYTTGNRITQLGAATFGSPDLDGNMTSRTVAGVTTTFAWTADNRLKTATQGATTLTYDYDAFGRLVRRLRNGSVERYFLWDGDQLLVELVGNGGQRIAEYAYLPGVDQPHAIVTGANSIGAIRYFHQDEMGNVMGVSKDTTVSQWIDYEPWGTQLSVTGTLADTNRLRWKGLPWEGDITQLYYVRNRWYDASGRRFLSEDPIGIEGGLNEYGFGDGDGINYADPHGTDKCEWGFWPDVRTEEGRITFIDVYCSNPAIQSGFSTNFGDPLARGRGGFGANEQVMFRSSGGAGSSEKLGPLANAVVGFGDCASLGLTAKVRGWTGDNEVVDTEAFSYGGGCAAGQGALLGVGESFVAAINSAGAMGGVGSSPLVNGLFRQGRGLLNSNRYLRIGFGRYGGDRVFRITGRLLGGVHVPLWRFGPL